MYLMAYSPYMVKNDAKMAQEVLNETLDLPKHIRYAHE